MFWFAMRNVWWRQLQQLLANPVSYVFLLVFTLICASVQFLPLEFYIRNICDFQYLNTYMPWLAAVFIPAIAMNSWASERQAHTDESLLTLPINITDIICGKWLGLCSYWGIALLASLSNVIVLFMLGSPDLGLLLAQYISWMLIGIMLCAASLFASCLVSFPPIAFIIGCLFTSSLIYMLQLLSWDQHFSRGQIHINSFLYAFSIVAFFLGACVLKLSSKRWQPQDKTRIITQISICVLGIFILFNIALFSSRLNSAIDISEEQISSLSQDSIKLIKNVDKEMHIHAFISKDIPDSYHIKSLELTNTLQSIAALNSEHIHLHIKRPNDPLDHAGEHARKHFGIEAKRVHTSKVVGGQQVDVFLGIAIQSGKRKHIIPFFNQGMTIEFEIVRALHTLNKNQLPQLAIVANDFPLLAHHDYRSDRMRRESPIVNDWRKHFDVRECMLTSQVPEDIDVLVVPLPSSLSQKELDHLQAYLWRGGRALLFEDPAPMWSHIELAASFSRAQFYQARGLNMPNNRGEKGDVAAFYQSLGLHIPLKEVVWSDHNPSFKLRQMWPQSIVWSMRIQQAFSNHPACTGIDSVLMPFPGNLQAIPQSKMQITPLLSTSRNSSWGKHQLSEYISYAEGTGFRHHKPAQFQSASEPYAILAAEAQGPITPSINTQTLGEQKDCQVIVFADIDFMHDQFYELHSKAQPEFHEDDLATIRRLQNIDLVNNCLDSLTGDTQLLSIRTRQLKYRSLFYIENIQRQKERYKKQVFNDTRDATLAEQERAKDFQEQLLKEIKARKDLSDTGKQQLLETQIEAGKASFEQTLISIKRKEAERFKDADITYRRAIDRLIAEIRIYALAIPGCILLLLAGSIWIYQLLQERALIPGQRLRERP